jgi:shikimate kinase
LLVGFMGAGKSSVGRALSQRLGWPFQDLDERIAQREGRSVAEILRTSGEREFRRIERATLHELLDDLRAGSVMVVALGGGAFVQKGNAARIESCGFPTVFLDAPVEELWRRCQNQDREKEVDRPLLGDLKRFQRLYETRRTRYLKASLRIGTEGKDVEAIAAGVAKAFHLKRKRRA